MSSYTFDQLPEVIATLADEIRDLKSLIKTNSAHKAEPRQEWMTLKELQQYHPEHPAAPTVYGWVRSGIIPHYKKGKKLIFKTAEIEQWLNAGRQKSDSEIEAEAIEYINQRRAGK